MQNYQTVNKNDGFLDGVLVVELWVKQRLINKRAEVGTLVPAHVQMIDVNMTKIAHHLHLVRY